MFLIRGFIFRKTVVSFALVRVYIAVKTFLHKLIQPQNYQF